MNNEKLTIKQIETAPIGMKIKTTNSKIEAVRISEDNWEVKMNNKVTTMHHSRIVPVRHTRTHSLDNK